MKTRIIAALLSVLLQTNSSFGQESDSVIIQRTDALLADAMSKGIFSGLVIISHEGKVLYHNRSGFADWNTKREMNDSTLFNIGSLNKQFTEEMIHQLVKEKQISYSDPLSRYLDLYPAETGDKITIRRLLDMKAGLGDYLQDPKFNEIRSKNFSLSDVMKIIKKEPLVFEPGTKKQYSNSGYVVLGAVIEKVTGISYEANLKKRIAEPLGLRNIYYTKTEKAKQANRAFGTQIDFEGRKKSTDDISNSTPAGGMYTNGVELLKFVESKLRNTLPSGGNYGTGMFGGGTPLWNCSIYYDQNIGFAFIIMANTGSIADELAQRIGSIIKKEYFPPLDLPFTMTLYKIIKEQGFDFIRNNADSLAALAHVPYDDRFLNFFGYQFIEAGNKEIAISLFKINVELFPKSPNAFDSLAEAYLKAGDKGNAAKYYSMELQLDPDNPRVKKAITELKGK